MIDPAQAAPRPGRLDFVELDVARRARGLRMVLLVSVPSPWSDAARWLFQLAGVDALAVRFRPGDADVIGWSGIPNAPVVFWEDEPPRSGWREILELGERLRAGGGVLVPAASDERERMLALAADIFAERGLVWSRRLLMVHRSIASEGREGFPLPLARLLGGRYGYAPERIRQARLRVIEVLATLERALASSAAAGHRYLLGPTLTAVDLYAAAALCSLSPLPEAKRPMLPALRPTFEQLDPDVAPAVTPALLAYRDFLWQRHLEPAADPPAPARSSVVPAGE